MGIEHCTAVQQNISYDDIPVIKLNLSAKAEGSMSYSSTSTMSNTDLTELQQQLQKCVYTQFTQPDHQMKKRKHTARPIIEEEENPYKLDFNDDLFKDQFAILDDFDEE
ncbi:Hypothetical_protein [Hexamita inflata]|uniref:Hypothetical_protein n=1 Tax=Hexamita inflata TaxID=28002 RepID=A0AA86P2I1_9EUKA|nr:Hypothetical protein HINF_LOCUS18013 [Hexamita inflata]